MKEKRINKIYEECIDNLEEKLLKCNIENREEVVSILHDDYSLIIGYEFYLVNDKGTVLEASTPGMLKIDEREITDGFRNYETSEKDTNIF